MTPQLEEAQRLVRLARRDAAACAALLHAADVDLAIACFHAQQSAEKALKAVLCLHGIEYRRTHDLEELAARVADAGAPAPVAEDDLRRLTPYAVEFRYDDQAIHLLTGKQAQRIAADLLGWAAGRIETSGDA